MINEPCLTIFKVLVRRATLIRMCLWEDVLLGALLERNMTKMGEEPLMRFIFWKLWTWWFQKKKIFNGQKLLDHGRQRKQKGNIVLYVSIRIRTLPRTWKENRRNESRNWKWEKTTNDRQLGKKSYFSTFFHIRCIAPLVGVNQCDRCKINVGRAQWNKHCLVRLHGLDKRSSSEEGKKLLLGKLWGQTFYCFTFWVGAYVKRGEEEEGRGEEGGGMTTEGTSIVRVT